MNTAFLGRRDPERGRRVSTCEAVINRLFLFFICVDSRVDPQRGALPTQCPSCPDAQCSGGGGAGGARAGPKAWCWEAVTGAAEAQRPLNATLILQIRHFGELTPARVRSASTPLQPE